MIVGENGPAVVLDAHMAAWLERNADLTPLRVRTRLSNPEIYKQLEEIHEAAVIWRSSTCGTTAAVRPEPAASSEWLSTTQAAGLLGVTSRAVRKSIALGHLDATLVGNRYRISREDVEHHRLTRGR